MADNTIKKVSIIPGCTSCGTCEVICPQVFEVKDISHVKTNVDLNRYAEQIREAAQICPVNVINVESASKDILPGLTQKETD